MTTNEPSHTVTIEVSKPVHHVFECLLDVSKWWGGRDLAGATSRLNDEFTIRHGDAHYSRQKMVEFVPDQRIVWLVTESRLGWLAGDKEEWTNTRLVFELVAAGDRTGLRFTHEGLVFSKESYPRCSEGWNLVIGQYLSRFITDGIAQFA